ncbi:putative antirepressor [Mycobacterium phage Pukovnik]|uniref:Antirepressor n=1 Tax=Mycobacterium phage Pukovnik TaxID=2914013 RepID=B3VGL7_9CAUD|nr:anti-repressor Ant [Mycobacterium phage Pukovnik]ACE79994.1 putative antirepressor [Mycobacterium phage Pukovnik]
MTTLTSTERERMSEIEKFQFQNVPSADEGGLVINAEVRVVTIEGEPWFVAKDVCEVLGLTNPTVVVSRLDADERAKFDLGPFAPAANVVNESGLYALIVRSDKPQAKAFRKWVTSEVLPTIRKTGGYLSPELDLSDPDVALAKLIEVAKAAQEARAKAAFLENKIAVDAPKVRAAEEFFDMEGLFSLRDSARKLGVPPFTFNDHLRSWGWIDEKGTAAKAYAVSMGYAENRIYIHPGSGAATTQGRLTAKGLERAAIKLDKEGTWVGYAAR